MSNKIKLIDNVNCVPFGKQHSNVIPQEDETQPLDNELDDDEELDDEAILEQFVFSKSDQMIKNT